MIVPRLTFFTENFVICRQSNLRNFPLWARLVPVRLLQEALVIFVFQQISQCGSFGKCVYTLCSLERGSTFARGFIGSSWDELEVFRLPCSGLLQGSVEALPSTTHSLNSCCQLGNSCDMSLCTSSDSPFLLKKFSVSVDSCSGSSRSSSLVLPLLSGTGFSVYLLTSNTESCHEDDGEVGEGVVEEELADKPGTTNGHSGIFCNQFSCPFRWDVVFDRWSSGRYTHDPQRASREKELREFLQETQLSRISQLYRGFFSGLHLAVGRHHRRRTPRCPHGLQLSRVKVSFTDHMHTRSWNYHKLSFLRLVCWRSREYPFLRGKIEYSLVFFCELVHVFGKIPSLASGTSLLSFSLFMGPVLKFHSVGTSLMRNFDIYFSQRRSFLFPDTRLTLHGLCESYSLNWFQDFLHRVLLRLSTLRNECIWILWYTTQLWYTAYYLVVHQPCNAETGTCLQPHNPFHFYRNGTRGMPIFTRRSRASTSQIVSARLSKNGLMVTFASSTSLPRTHFDLVIRLAQKAWRQCVQVFVHDLGLRDGSCIGLLANTGLVLFTGNRYLFLLQRRTIPFDSWPLLLFRFFPCLASKFRNRSFWSMLLFTIIIIFCQSGFEIFCWISMSYNSKTVLSCADSRILNLHRLSRISSGEIFDIDNKISSHLVSNPWTLSSRWATEKKSA